MARHRVESTRPTVLEVLGLANVAIGYVVMVLVGLALLALAGGAYVAIGYQCQRWIP